MTPEKLGIMSDRQEPKTKNTLFSYGFKKRKDVDKHPFTPPRVEVGQPSGSNDPVLSDQPRFKSQRVIDPKEIDATLHNDPGKRIPIWKYNVNKRDDIRRAYIMMGPCRPVLKEYRRSRDGQQYRRFQASWFSSHSWLEYSEKKDKVYCFPCFLFETDPPKHPAFTVDGFNSWKRATGQNGAFIQHEGGPCSPHMNAIRSMEALMNPSQHIDRVINVASKEEVLRNRLRIMATIECVRWLAFQACPFRGHHESISSVNRGNFLELLEFVAKLNEEIRKVVLNEAPGNVIWIAPEIQKDVLHCLATRLRKKICDEIGGAKFCILVDEARDESNREQMAIIIRFVDYDGYVRERFLDIVRVVDTTAVTLKGKISDVLDRNNLLIKNIRGQGYDGGSNMRGSFNGVQALFLRECPYAYYVHCFAHRLQLALVSASKDVHDIWLFYSKLSVIINIVGASPKRHNELQATQKDEIDNMIDTGELQTGRGANQIGTLQRAGATRWSSHYRSVDSLIKRYSSSCKVIRNIMNNDSRQDMRGEAKGALLALRSFDFIFILHLLNNILRITNDLCKALQQKSQDITNAMNLVSTTKTLLQKFRNDGWAVFLNNVESFCKKHDIDMPDMGSRYMEGTRRSCQQRDYKTVESHYHFDIFNEVIDFQFREINDRFTEEAVELLILSSALDPRDSFISFNKDHICTLAEKFYPTDFTSYERSILRNQLQHYELDVPHHQHFQKMSTMSELCRGLVKTKKSSIYHLIDRLIRLVLTLPVSTASTERAFSSMKLIKTALRNKMEDEFLADCMITYIERELAESIDIDSIIDDFDDMKKRKAPLR